MSEQAVPNLGQGAESVDSTPRVSAGNLLRQAREAAGLHIAALEADRLDLLPDAVFARALASSVCRTLKVDPVPVLASLPQSTMPRLHTDAQGINTPFSTPGLNPRATVWEQLSRPVVIAALALVLGALVLVLLPSAEPVAPANAVNPTESKPPVAAPATNSSAPVTTLSLRPSELMAPKEPLKSDVVAQPATSAPKPESVAVAAAAPVPLPLPAREAVQELAGTGGLVVLSARATSWVEVTDKSGVVQLRKTLTAGESVSASGGLPLVVTVGRADATDVQVRGKPFDLTPMTKNNVARFEVR